MRKHVALGPDMPEVCRLGLATRGGSRLQQRDVEWAIGRGMNYLNWCGHPDGLSRAVARLGAQRASVAVAVQFEARERTQAAREFETTLEQLGTGYLDVATLYYVESQEEWREIAAPGGAIEYLADQKRAGRLRLIGLTSHQRKLAASWIETGLIDLLMIRYNAAHRGAERDIFPVSSQLRIPVVTFTGLRWGALLKPTPDDPPGFVPPGAAAWYRFCLANENVSVALAAPGNRVELEHDLELLGDEHEPDSEEMTAMREHGDRVKRHFGTFW